MAYLPSNIEFIPRERSLERAQELKNHILPYLEAEKGIPTGMNQASAAAQRKAKIMTYFQATEEDWRDWHWQMRHRVTDAESLAGLFHLDPACYEAFQSVAAVYRVAVSPYYLSLIDYDDPLDPIWLQSLPQGAELDDPEGLDDPMGEQFTSPAPCITRRYPDRLIINVTNMCGMYCRHCQRRRNIGEIDKHKTKQELMAALDYIRKTPEIRDVLITGGDALMLSDNALDWLLTELDEIPHVEIKRIGTRTLATLPMRITDRLADILAKHPPLFINTQFNHPKEITLEAKEAADKLVGAGVLLGNQAVLLKRINTDPYVMKKMNHELLRIRVRPYYIFHAKNVKGTRHFLPSIQEGLKVMEELRGYTSGLAIPTYIINAPQGGGKTPLVPQYLEFLDEEKAVLRTWEGKVFEYKNHSEKN